MREDFRHPLVLSLSLVAGLGGFVSIFRRCPLSLLAVLDPVLHSFYAPDRACTI